MPSKGTPRTATTKWKALRLKVIRRAKRDGVTHCLECGVALDYGISGLRNSAEVDHIVSYAQGGKDLMSNCRVICRRCNQSLGAKVTKQPKSKRSVVTEQLQTSQEW